MYPMCYMYGIFTYIWVISRAYAGKYSLHGAYWTYIYICIVLPYQFPLKHGGLQMFNCHVRFLERNTHTGQYLHFFMMG